MSSVVLPLLLQMMMTWVQTVPDRIALWLLVQYLWQFISQKLIVGSVLSPGCVMQQSSRIRSSRLLVSRPCKLCCALTFPDEGLDQRQESGLSLGWLQVEGGAAQASLVCTSETEDS